jgi:hypothetical protein
MCRPPRVDRIGCSRTCVELDPCGKNSSRGAALASAARLTDQDGPSHMRCATASSRLMRAEGVDAADLADITGHSVETMDGRYTHALRRSFEQVRALVG